MFENPLSDAFAPDIAGLHRSLEVDPAKEMGRAIFSRCFGEAPELAGDARVGCTARHPETDKVCVEEPGHHRSHSSPLHRMGRGVILYRLSRKTTQPFATARSRIAVAGRK